MIGIDLNKPITFLHSSLRFFVAGERHITRLCKDDVLLMVFDGILRFTEDNVEYEIHPGEYHIQKHDTFQSGEKESASPKYLYVHFRSEWSDTDTALPVDGFFDINTVKPLMNELDRLSHTNSLLIQKVDIFFKILISLQQKKKPTENADRILKIIQNNDIGELSLNSFCRELHFSKNHIINLFKKEFGTTPTKYINGLKLNYAKYLLEVTSDTIDDISQKSGFDDYSYFYKLFKRETGLSPTIWRRKKHIEPSLY